MRKDQSKPTKEEKVRHKLIDSIRALTKYKMYTLGQIETTLNLPRNSLSGMLNGTRNMPPHWQTLLQAFIDALPNEDKTIIIKIADANPEPEEAIPVPTPQVPAPPIVQAKIETTKKMPPPGLDRIALQRWYRENT